jgi:hypothetical protein
MRAWTFAFVFSAGCTVFPWDAPPAVSMPDAAAPIERVLLATAIVGAEGATIEGEGIALTIPAGALSAATQIDMYLSSEVPEGYEPLTPLFELEPAGLHFAQTVRVSLDVPEDATGVVLWSNEAGDGFEFAGFIEGGIAQGESAHFSGVMGSKHAGACGTEGGCGDGCAAEEDEEGVPEPPPGNSCEGVQEVCQQLCYCHANDQPAQRLCATDVVSLDPENAEFTCPDDNAAIGEILAGGSYRRMATGREMLGERNGRACFAWAARTVVARACYCEGLGHTVDASTLTPETSMCPTGRLIDPDGNPATRPLQCVSSVHGEEPNVLLGHTRWNHLGYRGWTGVEGAACTGQYENWQGQRETGTGVLTDCSDEMVVGTEWRSLPGVFMGCQGFAWPADSPGASRATPLGLSCGELSGPDFVRLQMARTARGMAPRTPNGGGTAAILRADGMEFRGYNNGAYPADDRPRVNPFCGGGGYTPRHAEGNALNELAALRMSVPVVARALNTEGQLRCPEDPVDALGNAVTYSQSPIGTCEEGGVRGCAELIVDRDPCAANCARYGIERMRRAACLEELIVRSPSGTRRFGGGVGAESGEAAPGATCPPP